MQILTHHGESLRHILIHYDNISGSEAMHSCAITLRSMFMQTSFGTDPSVLNIVQHTVQHQSSTPRLAVRS